MSRDWSDPSIDDWIDAFRSASEIPGQTDDEVDAMAKLLVLVCERFPYRSLKWLLERYSVASIERVVARQFAAVEDKAAP